MKNDMDPIEKANRSGSQSSSDQTQGSRRPLSPQATTLQKQEELDPAERALAIQKKRLASRGGLAEEKESLQGLEKDLLLHRHSEPFLLAKKGLSDAKLALENQAKKRKPELDARLLLLPKRLLNPSHAQRSHPAALNANSMISSGEKMLPIVGIALAVVERMALPSAVLLGGVAGSNSIIHDAPMNTAISGFVFALAGVSVGSRLLPEAYKLGRWQDQVKRESHLETGINELFIKRATEQMVDAYAAGMAWFTYLAFSFYLARDRPVAVITSSALFLAGALVAVRAAQPARENWHGPAAAGLGFLAATIGSMILLVDTKRFRFFEPTSESHAGFQANVGFPAAVGLFAAAGQFNGFIAQRTALKGTRHLIDEALLEKEMERKRNNVETMSEHDCLQREAQLAEAVVRAKMAVSEAEEHWIQTEPLEKYILQCLESV